MANIFLLNPMPSREDRLTSHWAYLLDVIPGLGQRFTDWVADRTGLARTDFVAVLDHPPGTMRDRPDFLLRGRDWAVVFEHKIAASLGAAQLERYLEYVGASRKTYVALLAPRLVSVPVKVRAHRRYLRPTGQVPHFLWQQIFPLLDHHRSRLGKGSAASVISLDRRGWGSIRTGRGQGTGRSCYLLQVRYALHGTSAHRAAAGSRMS